MNLYPLYEAAANADALVRAGATVWQQFLCENCGTKQTMGVENQFFTQGQCEECGHITDLRVTGCNFMALVTREK